jgi:hypothetical protein
MCAGPLFSSRTGCRTDQAARCFARGARAVGGALHSYDQNVGLGSSRVPREITIPTGSTLASRC